MITYVDGKPVLWYNFSAKSCETKEPKRVTAGASTRQHRACVPLSKGRIAKSKELRS